MRTVVSWLGLVPLMILNGVLRNSVYGPALPELRAHQVSTLSGIVIVLGYATLVFPWLRIVGRGVAWRVGAVWVGLTVAFEFGFGHYVAGHPWSRLLLDYDLRAGRVWSILLVAVLVAPAIALRLRRPVRGMTGR